MDLMVRRRAMLAGEAKAEYIKDGLVFFLDGLNRGDTSGEWTDTIGGKTFKLFGNYTEYPDGIYFGGSAYGLYDGQITDNCLYETCEVVLSALSSNATTGQGIFIQPIVNNKLGYSVYHRAGNWWFQINGTRHVPYKLDISKVPATISTHSSVGEILGVQNGKTIQRNGQFNDWGGNTTGKTIIAGRLTSGNPYQFYTGKIMAIRIYNRQISYDEILNNHKLDNIRYNLGLDI